MILLELANGVQATYLQCHYTPDSCRNYTVIGTRGRIENYGDGHEGTTVELWDRRADTFRRRGDATFRTAAPVGGHGGADEKIVRAFLRYLCEDRPPDTTPQAARYSVACGCAGAESIRSGGRPVDVPPLPDDLERYSF